MAVLARQGRPRSVRDRPLRVGLARHRLCEVRPLGPERRRPSPRTSKPTGSSRGACCCGSPPPTRSPTGSCRARSSSSAPRTRRSIGRTVGAPPTPTISGCASGSGTSGTFRSAASRGGRSFTSAWAWTRTRSSARAPSARDPTSSGMVGYYGLTDNEFRPAGAAGNMAVHYYPLPFLRFEALGMVGSPAAVP